MNLRSLSLMLIWPLEKAGEPGTSLRTKMLATSPSATRRSSTRPTPARPLPPPPPPPPPLLFHEDEFWMRERARESARERESERVRERARESKSERERERERERRTMLEEDCCMLDDCMLEDCCMPPPPPPPPNHKADCACASVSSFDYNTSERRMYYSYVHNTYADTCRVRVRVRACAFVSA